MTNPNEHLDPSASSEQPPAPAQPTAPVEKQEAKEVLPELEVTIRGTCNTDTGPYISLNAAQRAKLNVSPGDAVTVTVTKDTQQSQMTLVVGQGRKGQKLDESYANGIPEGSTIKVQPGKAKESAEAHTLEIAREMEKHEKHPGRSKLISERFPELDREAYLVVPTNISILLGAPGEGTSRKIWKGKVRIGGNTVEIAMVPSGDKMGLTSKASEAMNIPGNVASASLLVDNSILVIDQVK